MESVDEKSEMQRGNVNVKIQMTNGKVDEKKPNKVKILGDRVEHAETE